MFSEYLNNRIYVERGKEESMSKQTRMYFHKGGLLANSSGFFANDREPLAQRLWVASGGADVVAFEALPKKMYMITDPEVTWLVMNSKNVDRGKFAGIVAGDWGNPQGFAFASGDVHHRQRQALSPVGHDSHYGPNIEKLYAFIDAEIKGWKGEFALYPAMHDLFEKIAQILVFGQLIEDGEAIADMFNRSGVLVEKFSPKAWTKPLDLLKRLRQFKQSLKKTDVIVLREINKRLASYASGEREASELRDMLDYILVMFQNDQELYNLMAGKNRDPRVDEVRQFDFGIADTSATANTFALAFGSTDETVWGTMGEEIVRVLGNRTPQFPDIPALEFLGAVFEESTAQRPPAPLVARDINADIGILGIVLEKGRTAWAPYYFNNQRILQGTAHPEFFPWRWVRTDKNYQKFPRGTFNTFGLGDTSCIGARLARATGKLVLVAGHRNNLRVTRYPKGLPPEFNITLNPSKEIMARVG